ncbi:flagellar hook assembly protein FlgD [Lacimicrobium alkaliphilum]|uniref:Basal-body rod modification protein FlgD n=1 Tax=Lacimicrobium alkaliphilum TaxID=1526571 RepID=A0A0U3B1F6_9ALTE|nr:flagellar hook assembly protein FlgD [Lacimicrobium alkaliphilum]ALS99096.1 flagellar biosynthesis protein FlgD [Lacimicrobium alkaliphilum]
MENVSNNKDIRDLYWKDESKVPEPDDGKLTQEDFFSLLTEQLAMQDPTKPVDNDQMIAQMTNFTMADSLNKLNVNFEDFAANMNSSQALQASSLIGQDVLVMGNKAALGAEGAVSGVIINEQSVQDMKITVEDQFGQTVRTMNIGTNEAGNIQFGWDGTDGNGNLLPPGNYKISASGKVGDETKDLPTAINRHVNSVSLASSSQGVILNLAGDESVKIGDVLQIGKS